MFNKFAIIFFIALNVIDGKQSECANSEIVGKSGLPVVELGGQYYYFGIYFTANFFRAMRFCRDHGMDLLSIETNKENTRILNYIERNFKRIHNFWTSGSNLGEERHFVWLATGKSFNFTYWNGTQPNNEGNKEHCVEILPIMTWNDAPCTDTDYFICEVQEYTFSASNEKTGPLWYIHMGNRDNPAVSSRGALISYNGIDANNNYPQVMDEKFLKCMNSQSIKNSMLPLVELGGQFYYFEKYFKTNYFKAMQFCREHGMDLLSIETGEEYIEIINHLKKNYRKHEQVWTSGTDAGEEGVFVWLSTGRGLNFTNWGQNLPDNSGKVEHCLELFKSGVDNYIWNDRICTNLDYFICEARE